MNVKEKASQLLDQVRQDVSAHLKSVGKWPSLKELVASIVRKVEAEGGNGASKRQLAVEAALLSLRFVLPPAWSRFAPDWALRMALGWMVDQTVAAFNKSGWK